MGWFLACVIFLPVVIGFALDLEARGHTQPKNLPCSVPIAYERMGSSSKFLVSVQNFYATELGTGCVNAGLKHGSIDSPEENVEVSNYLIATGNNDGVWIDAVAKYSDNIEGVVKRDGNLLNFSRFYEAEPNNNAKGYPDACVYTIVVSGSSSPWPHLHRSFEALWNDVQCNHAGIAHYRRVLCQCEEAKSSFKLNNELQALRSTKFYISNYQQNWTNAIQTCTDYGMLPAIFSNALEIEEVRIALANSTVAYWFLWFGATRENGRTSWLGSTDEFQPIINNLGIDIPKKLCLNFGVGNSDKLFTQAQDCSIPLHFLCAEAPQGHVPPKCKARESFKAISKSAWVLKNSKLTFESARLCCSEQNWSLFDINTLLEQKDTISASLQNNGLFWAGVNGTCAEVNFTMSLNLNIPEPCPNVTRGVICGEIPMKPIENRNATRGSCSASANVNLNFPITMTQSKEVAAPNKAELQRFDWMLLWNLLWPLLWLLPFFLIGAPLVVGLGVAFLVVINYQFS